MAKLVCLGSTSDHFVRNCPSLPAAQQATERLKPARKTKSQKQVSAPSASFLTLI